MLRKSDGILGATTLCNLHGAAHRCSTVSRSDVFYRRGIRAGFQANKIQGTLVFWDYLELKLSIYTYVVCVLLYLFVMLIFCVLFADIRGTATRTVPAMSVPI